MNALEESRTIINETDEQLVKLFETRFAAVKQILEYKKANHLPVLDAKREACLIEKREGEVSEELRPYFREFYQALLAASRHYQSDHMDDCS
ncbi:MAG: chorismate mutase [Solobacterium sp.]|nr:chorismate mutase [Solobacterium sp.]MBR2794630.1 chorismate mutase [Solobacterium sp.]